MKRTVFVILVVLLSTAVGKVWYVHPDSTQDSIQPCLDACGVGDTVLVAAGTYHEKLIWPDVQGIKLLSESGPDSTVIDGDSSGIVVTIDVNVDTTTALEGLTITGGYSNDVGGGILIWNGSPMIRNNTLMENQARYGGGIAASYSKSIYIVNNRFIRNHATGYFGAAYVGYGTAFVLGNLFEQNVADTNIGAMHLEVEDGLVQGNVFTGNRAGFWHGGLVSAQSDAAIIGNTFAYDSAGQGNAALCFWECYKPVVAGNRIQHCRSPRATAVYCHSSSPQFVADTFADNQATSYYGIIYCEGGSLPHFRRCLIGDNSVPIQGAVTVVDSSSVTIDSCTITGNGCAGFYVRTGAGMAISNSNIYGNQGYGVNCEYYAESVEAYNNWWGDSTGPFHPDSNPGGHGDTVSDGVFFRPWLQDSVFFPGVLESHHRGPVGLPTQATVVHGVLLIGDRGQATGDWAALLDVAGREVMKLKPGANDARTLAPGVYFVRQASGAERDASSVTKVTVTR